MGLNKNIFYRVLFIDKKGDVSHTKFWSNIGYCLICLSYVAIVIKMFVKDNFDKWEWYTGTFAVFVVAQRGMSKYISNKYGNGNSK